MEVKYTDVVTKWAKDVQAMPTNGPRGDSVIKAAKELVRHASETVVNEIGITAGMHINQYAQQAAMHLEDAVSLAYMGIYGIPMEALVDSPEKWINVPDHPRIGSTIQVGYMRAVKINKVERHADTYEGSIVEVIRFNGDSALACMPYGTIFYTFHRLGDREPYNTFGISTYIQQFPYRVPMPIICEVYEDQNGLGLISDITRRFSVVTTQIMNESYSPAGTALYASKIPADAFEFIPAGMDAAPDEPDAEQPYEPQNDQPNPDGIIQFPGSEDAGVTPKGDDYL